MAAGYPVAARATEGAITAEPEAARGGNPRSWSWRVRLLWVGAAVLLLASSVGGLYWRSRNIVKLTDKDTIVLADLSNHCSDPVFEDGLNTALRVELEQTPFLNLLAADKVRGTLKLLNHPEDAKLTPDLAREVCLRTNSKAVVASSIADAGNHFRIELSGTDCQTGKTFARTQLDASGRNDVVRALGISGGELRRKLGEPEVSLRDFNKPLEEATSQSLEALRFLTEGIRHHASGDSPAALAYYNRAIQLDPNFALAYVYRGTAFGNVGDVALEAESEKKAYELRDRLTQRSRFLVEATYYMVGTWELEKSCQVHMHWLQVFPTDVVARIDLADCLLYLGHPERAAVEEREAIRLMPTALTYGNLMNITIAMDRLDEAKAAFDDAQARKIDDWQLRGNRYLVAFLQGDEAAMREQLTWARGKVGVEDWFLYLQADTKGYFWPLSERTPVIATSGGFGQEGGRLWLDSGIDQYI